MQIDRHNPDALWPVPEAFQTIYSHGLEVSGANRLMFLSGQIGVAPDGTVPSDFDGQCRQAMANVEALLSAADLSLHNALRITYYLTNPSHLAALTARRQERWSSAEPPAVTTLVVSALARPELLIEIEVIAGA